MFVILCVAAGCQFHLYICVRFISICLHIAYDLVCVCMYGGNDSVWLIILLLLFLGIQNVNIWPCAYLMPLECTKHISISLYTDFPHCVYVRVCVTNVVAHFIQALISSW